jgi:hypothetical protein
MLNVVMLNVVASNCRRVIVDDLMKGGVDIGIDVASSRRVVPPTSVGTFFI